MSNGNIVSPADFARQTGAKVPGYDPNKKVTRGEMDEIMDQFNEIIKELRASLRIHAMRYEGLAKMLTLDGRPPDDPRDEQYPPTVLDIDRYRTYLDKFGNGLVPVMQTIVAVNLTIDSRLGAATQWNRGSPEMPLWADDLFLEDLVAGYGKLVSLDEERAVLEFPHTDFFAKKWGVALGENRKKYLAGEPPAE